MMLIEGQLVEQIRTFTQRDFDRFAELSGDNNPIHVDPHFAARTQFGKTVAHGMFLYSVLCGVMLPALLPPGTIQIEQELVFPSPTYAAEAVKIILQVTSLQADQGLAEINTSFTRPNGELSCQGRTLVHLPGWGFTHTTPLAIKTSPGVDVSKLRNLELGQRARIKRCFSQADIDEYIAISQDNNPLILDGDFARGAGFKDRLLPYGLLGGIISHLLGTKLPGRGTNWLKQRFRYLSPAYPEEQIVANVEIVRLRPQKDLVNLRTECCHLDGKLICDGEALVLIKDSTDYS
jgi:acyl dehydratase